MAAMTRNDAPSFEQRDDVPALADGEIHVWSLRIEHAPDARTVGIGARAELERLLCAYADLTTPPLIERGEHGKPFAPALGDLEFNLSHAGSDVLLAFARAQPLGVDLERVDRRLASGPLARRFFAAEEAAALARVPAHLQQMSFMQLWTRKEAVLKALGQGLAFGLHRLSFAVADDGEIGGLQTIAETAGRAEQWHLRRLSPGDGLAAALAWRGADRTLRLFAHVP
jgi:4'-phosphopantetheinyl transferase